MISYEFISVHSFLVSLQPHHLSHNSVRHLDCADKDQHVEDQLADITPDHRSRRSRWINNRGAGSKHGEDDASQHDDRTFQTHPGIAFKETLADVLCRFTGESGQRDWRDSRIHIEFEEASVNAQDHDKAEHPDKQAAYQSNRP